MGIGHAKRVLVVQDNVLVAKTMGEVLSRVGLSSVIIHNLADAMIEAEPGNFEIALVDMNLRGEPAWPLLARLKESGKPFAVVTSFAPPELNANFPGLLIAIKPMGVKMLKSVVRKLLVQLESGSPAGASTSEALA